MFGPHPYYSEIINYPPKNIVYSQKKLPEYKSRRKLRRILLKKLLMTSKLPRFTYVTNTKKDDLIHSSRGILVLNSKPWVIDVDNTGAFVNFQYKLLERSFYRSIILRSLSSKFCKKIMPWSNAGKESILNTLNAQRISNKFHVLYPAMHIPKTKTKKRNDILNILFIGAFYRKGGHDLLAAFDTLSKRYDIGLTMVSDPPEEVKSKYSPHSNVKFFQLGVPRQDILEKIFPQADIFLYPTYWDIFGLVILEAMSFSIPVISSNIYAIPEIIENGKTGYMIKAPIFWHDKKYIPRHDIVNRFNEIIKLKHPEVVKEIVEKTSLLIEDSSLRKKMGRNGQKLIAKGKFSIKERNDKLRTFYEEAVK